MNSFSDLDIDDPKWADKFTDKWFNKCKELKVDPIQEFLRMLEYGVEDCKEEISLAE